MEGCGVTSALQEIDKAWFTKVSQHGRWMDIIGDFAGEELFIIDGDSLLGLVLDDRLLALGREEHNDNSFQFLHARFSLERVLHCYRKRNAVFEIVFFEDHRHTTLRTGSTEFVTASRSLAREFLKRSLRELEVPMQTFQNLHDVKWSQFFETRKPMFVMTDDGGPVPEAVDENAELKAACALVQRSFIFDLLASGIAVALMRGAEFKDSKIFSFVYEQRRIFNARDSLDPSIWTALTQASVMLGTELQTTPESAPDRHRWLCMSARSFMTSVPLWDDLAHPLLFLFIVHAVILDKISINLRAQPLPCLDPSLETYLHVAFLPHLFHCLKDSLPESPKFREVDLDGRTFLRLIQISISQPLIDTFDLDANSEIMDICEEVGVATGLAGLLPRFQSVVVPAAIPAVHDPNALSVLPFSHTVFNEHLAPVQVHVDSTLHPNIAQAHFDLGSGLGELFEDNLHWHNSRRHILPKHLGGANDKHVPSDPKSRNRSLRRDQRFHANLHRQAQSLTGALGKPLETIIVPPIGTKARTLKKAKQEPRPTHKGAGQKLTSVERTRLQIQVQKRDKKDSEDSSWWKATLNELEALDSLETRLQKIEALRNARTAEGWLAIEVRLYRLHVELLRWIAHPDREDPAVGDKFRISILDMIQAQKPHASPMAATILASVLIAVGFANLVTSASDERKNPVPDKKLSFNFLKVLKRSGSSVHAFMRLEEHPTYWMLRCFGEKMDRSLDSKLDPRVPFEPDGWQRKVLDVLDKDDASVLVVAPTSAGKTFISYYAMERVLRSSDDGILVYVAPTKALVTQIAAEVSARYSKEVDGHTFWAVHTRDYRIHDPHKCQILITVPEILSMMLLSPALANVWTPRLKTIILDEIHTIGQEDGGSVWEQILLLAPCRIIGLSATVGKPDHFNKWLRSVQLAHNFQHTFIEHPHRYSHLRKFFYLRPIGKPKPFAGLSNHNTTDRLRFIHPVCLLSSGIAPTIPPDFAMEAKDCLSLFKVLKQEARGDIGQEELDRLDPVNFFPHDRLIKQEDVLRYEKDLKLILERLIKAPHSYLSFSTLQSVARGLSDPVMAKVSEDILATAPPKRDMEDDFINLISDLHTEGDLPALVFAFDRNKCEKLAKRLLEILVESEEKWRDTNPEWLRKVQAWERYQAKSKDRERSAELLKRQKPNEDQRDFSDNTSWESKFDPSDPSPAFSFAGFKTTYNMSSLKADINELDRWTSTPKWALHAIKRGIAVHHAGMNRKYRSLIEMLFRLGFLRVMIATGTLALGINAPCRTVVFFGDSTYLTALQFRQAAGRAGRRGFDLLGKVVFYGLSLNRVQRVVLSRLPAIAGQFPLSTTLCLRLFNLLAGSQDAPYAKKAIKAILSLPQVSLGSNTGREELLHQLRFSIDYLQRAHLLSNDGQPLNLTGMVTHLHYHEPNNLAFVALLRSGVIHEICNGSPSKVDAMHKLMLVLCYLFGRKRLPRSALDKNILQSLRRRYPSMVILPPLPQEVRRVLVDHATLTLGVFTSYARTYAAQYATTLGPDNALPLSGLKFGTSEAPGIEPNLSRMLRETSLTFVARSAFVATSGHTDSFSTIGELCHNARKGLHLNENAIPSMDDILADDASPFKLNAYLLDFYTHGQVSPLVRANGIKRGDVWYLLQDFDLTLAAIKSSIQELLLKVSKQHAAAEDSEDDEDPAIKEHLDADDEDGTVVEDFPRPQGVSNEDWNVYEVVSDLWKDFNEKFHKMWA